MVTSGHMQTKVRKHLQVFWEQFVISESTMHRSTFPLLKLLPFNSHSPLFQKSMKNILLLLFSFGSEINVHIKSVWYISRAFVSAMNVLIMYHTGPKNCTQTQAGKSVCGWVLVCKEWVSGHQHSPWRALARLSSVMTLEDFSGNCSPDLWSVCSESSERRRLVPTV